MSSQTQSFQAEVRQLLDIVIHSLYTDKEIFIRELVSNASDAMEKLKLQQLTQANIYQAEKELQISISFDEENKTLTITDTGIGMTRDELVENLGTIAHSGTKAFLQSLKEKGSGGEGMIGQFGVGFYSVFMVADSVDVYTHSYREDAESLKWSSDGKEGYSIDEVEHADRGSKIVIHLKEDQAEYAKSETIKDLLKKYSNFVAFPILVNDERVNTVEALWLKGKNDVTEEEYKEFYKFTAHAWDAPRFTMHFSADAPLDIHALLFVPEENQERYGMGQMPPGVSLYSRRVLIDAHPEGLLPEWLRFVRGVIDSADIPLNISRESMQDSALVKKIGNVVTKRLLKFLEKQAADDKDKYKDFYENFSRYIKEGIVSSYEHKETLSGLLRFESTMTEKGEQTSFADYIVRMKESQNEIYYIAGLSREAAENSPYLEAFKARGLEVLFLPESIDQYLFENIGAYQEKKVVSVSQADVKLDEHAVSGESLSDEETADLTSWWLSEVDDEIKDVKSGERLIDSPVIALVPADAPNQQMRSMMKVMGQDVPEIKPVLEINPRHAFIKKLSAIRKEKPELSKKIAHQLADQALLAAGLIEHPQKLSNRMNEIIAELLEK